MTWEILLMSILLQFSCLERYASAVLTDLRTTSQIDRGYQLPQCIHLGHPMSSDHSSDSRRKQAWQHLNHCWPWRCSLVARQAGILCKELWSIIAIQICCCYSYRVPCWRCCCGIACESRKLRVRLAEFLNCLRQSKPPRMHDGFHWAIIQTVFDSCSTSRNELHGYQDLPERFWIPTATTQHYSCSN